MSKRKAGGAYQDFVNPDELFTDEEEQIERPNNNKKHKAQRKHSPGKHAEGSGHKKEHNGRTRPTNNQLLYKAYFRWGHYPCMFKPGSGMPTETDACASVTSAFLQVLQTLQAAEQHRSAGSRHQRSVLQILSTNTRRTKVVELSSGTHRVPEELKKHYLSDGEGGQYSTNLDRNRYGNDDNYLFTVIRYDLEFLGLCPCMVDVEIIDAKAGNQSVIVSAGADACTCQHKPATQPMNMGGYVDAPMPMPIPILQQPQQPAPPVQRQPDPHHHLHHHHPDPVQPPAMPAPGREPPPVRQQQQPPPAAAAVEPAPVKREVAPSISDQPLLPTTDGGNGVGGLAAARLGVRSLPARSRDSPRPSGSGMSQLFDALVMAATGGADGAAAGGGLGGEPPVTSAFLNALPGPGAEEAGGARPQPRGPQLHHAPMRNKSRLWSAMSFGDMDSLQNALDAFRAEEEIASQPYTSSPDLNGGQSGEGLLRQRRRKPPRGNSSFLLRTTDSLGDISLSKLGIKFDGDSIAGLTFDVEKSGDNQEAGFAAEGGVAGADAEGPADSQGDERAEGAGTSGEVGEEVGDGHNPHERSRFRHVPRQASAVNLSTRVSAAELARLRQEVDLLKAENKKLSAASKTVKDDGLAGQVRQLQQELALARDERVQMMTDRKTLEDQLQAHMLELNRCRHEMQVMLSKVQHQQNAMAHMAQLNQLAAAAGGAAGPAALLGHPAALDPALAALAAMNNPATALGAAMVKQQMQQMMMGGAGHAAGLAAAAAYPGLGPLLAAQHAAAHSGLQNVHDAAAGMMGAPELAAAMMMGGGNHLGGGGAGASGSAGPHRGRSGASGSIGAMSGSAGTAAGAGTGLNSRAKGDGAPEGGPVDGDVQQQQQA